MPLAIGISLDWEPVGCDHELVGHDREFFMIGGFTSVGVSAEVMCEGEDIADLFKLRSGAACPEILLNFVPPSSTSRLIVLPNPKAAEKRH